MVHEMDIHILNTQKSEALGLPQSLLCCLFTSCLNDKMPGKRAKDAVSGFAEPTTL